MAWTGEVIDVKKNIDTILVTVRYTDGVKTFDEVYKSYNAPDAEWIPRTVKERILQLDGVDKVSISTGIPSQPTDVTEKNLFFTRLRKYERLVQLVSIGLVPADNATLLSLKTWLSSKIATYIDEV